MYQYNGLHLLQEEVSLISSERLLLSVVIRVGILKMVGKLPTVRRSFSDKSWEQPKSTDINTTTYKAA